MTKTDLARSLLLASAAMHFRARSGHRPNRGRNHRRRPLTSRRPRQRPRPPTTKAATEEIVVTARRTEETVQRVPSRDLGLQRARARPHPGDRHHRPSGRGPQPQHRPGPRLVQRHQHLHSRHRPARRAADVRPGGRRLCRRRLSFANSRQPARPARSRADRSAARPARHALRQEHHRRRDQVRLAQAGPGFPRQRQHRARQLRSIRA